MQGSAAAWNRPESAGTGCSRAGHAAARMCADGALGTRIGDGFYPTVNQAAA